MENRRPIYHPGNSIKPPVIDEKCRKAVKGHKRGTVFEMPIRNKYKRKACATLECLWCGRKFNDYRVSCPACHNCQYCGFKVEVINECRLCGNKAPDDIAIKPKKLKIL